MSNNKHVNWISMKNVNWKHEYMSSLFLGLWISWKFLNSIQSNLVIKMSDITKPSYNKVILLVPPLYISVSLPWYEKPDTVEPRYKEVGYNKTLLTR